MAREIIVVSSIKCIEYSDGLGGKSLLSPRLLSTQGGWGGIARFKV